MLRLSYLTETILFKKITGNRIVLSFKDSPRKPLRRRPLKETDCKLLGAMVFALGPCLFPSITEAVDFIAHMRRDD